jgi:hypothetical protein
MTSLMLALFIVVVLLFLARTYLLLLMDEAFEIYRLWVFSFVRVKAERRRERRRGSDVMREGWRPRLPSLSRGLVSLAVHRLPAQMSPAEKTRWEEEMKADVAAIPKRPRRFLVAFRIWRKGAAKMPTGSDTAVRPAGD